jgi:import inner membrane translocase subunit TIM23
MTVVEQRQMETTSLTPTKRRLRKYCTLDVYIHWSRVSTVKSVRGSESRRCRRSPQSPPSLRRDLRTASSHAAKCCSKLPLVTTDLLYTSRQLSNMATPSIARSSCFRVATHFSRFFAAPAPSKASFTTSSAPLNQLRTSCAPRASLPSITFSIASRRIAAQCKPQPIRHASTASQPAPAAPAPEILTWNRFFDLRRKRRFINLGASLVTAAITVGVAAPMIANNDIDSWGAQISGMDPFIVLGVSTFIVATAGWMCGPTFGTAGFKLWAGRRGWNEAIAQVSWGDGTNAEGNTFTNKTNRKRRASMHASSATAPIHLPAARKIRFPTTTERRSRV